MSSNAILTVQEVDTSITRLKKRFLTPSLIDMLQACLATLNQDVFQRI